MTMKVWFITGVSSGLGRSLATAAIHRGDRVLGTVRKEQDGRTLQAALPGLSYAVTDVTDAAGLKAAAQRAEDELGGLDILVNNAGQGFTAAIEEASLDEVRAVFEVNVLGAISAIQAVLPAMRNRRSGHIINISSISGFKPWSGTGIYCASKFALEGIGQTLAQELAPFNINVTNVQPGGLRTDFAGRSLHHAARRIDAYADGAHAAPRLLAKAHGKEGGDPDKAAAAILALADSSSPPLNLLLGTDALTKAIERIATLNVEIDRWASVSRGIDVHRADPGN
jgi:NAD(P)-dependent dehydrogenase (short-subunit alcohol dehydrogenase family)